MDKVKQFLKKILAVLRNFYIAIRSLFKGLCKYSGLQLVYRKFVPNDDKLPSGPLWLIGIYVAAFGLAEQLYENRIGIIENRANTILKMIGTEKRTFALSLLPSVLGMKAPVRPDFWNPISVTKSLMAECSLPEKDKKNIGSLGIISLRISILLASQIKKLVKY
jgi:hypothetical protein